MHTCYYVLMSAPCTWHVVGYDMGIIVPTFNAYTSGEVVAATQNF